MNPNQQPQAAPQPLEFPSQPAPEPTNNPHPEVPNGPYQPNNFQPLSQSQMQLRKSKFKKLFLWFFVILVLGGLIWAGLTYTKEKKRANDYQKAYNSFVSGKELSDIKTELNYINTDREGILARTFTCQLTTDQLWNPTPASIGALAEGYNTQLNRALAALNDPVTKANSNKPKYAKSRFASFIPEAKSAEVSSNKLDSFFSELSNMSSNSTMQFCNNTLYGNFEVTVFMVNNSQPNLLKQLTLTDVQRQADLLDQNRRALNSATIPESMKNVKQDAENLMATIGSDLSVVAYDRKTNLLDDKSLPDRFATDKQTLDQIFAKAAQAGKDTKPIPADLEKLLTEL